MASTNGYNTGNYSCTGLINLKADELNADTIICDTIETSLVSYEEMKQLQGINTNTNIQDQINGLVNNGGCFAILATQNTGFVANTYWGFNSGTNPTTNIPLVFGYAFKLSSITITCQSVPTSAATVRILQNGSVIYTMSSINSLTQTFNDINMDFSNGDTFNIFTVSGTGGGLVRATISCKVGAVQGLKGDPGTNGLNGQTPSFTIGTVSNLTTGSIPTVSLTGSPTNPVLNFGLVQGVTGSQGPKGDTGPQGPKGDSGSSGGSVSGDVALALCVGIEPLPIGTVLDGAVGDIVTINTSLDGIGNNLKAINDEIDALQGKTQYMTANTTTDTTSFSSKLTTTGDIVTSGDITATGFVNGTNISGTATTTTLSTNAAISTTLLGANIYLGSFDSQVYVNNIPLTPFSSASSFFNQW